MTTRRTAMLVISSALATSVGGCAPGAAPGPPPGPHGGGDLPRARLGTALRDVAARSGASDVSAAVLRPDGTLWQGETGRGVRAWGSITKVPVAAAAISLAEAGTWRLSDPVSRYVPGVRWARAVTLSDLMAHTAGLPRDVADAPRAVRSAAAERAALATLVSAGRGRFAYSNAGYRALALAMETATGRPWQAVVHDRVLRPAGADALALPRRNAAPMLAAPGAAGALRGPAADVARMLDALLAGRIVSPEGLRAMGRPLRRSENPALRYGSGLITYDLPDGTRWIGHSGGTREGRAVVAWMPDKGVTVALALGGQRSAEAGARILVEAL